MATVTQNTETPMTHGIHSGSDRENDTFGFQEFLQVESMQREVD